jgi:hypothetical protein
MTIRYLAPGVRCSAYWYARRGGMLPYGITDPDDLEFLRDLGLRAARLARWLGVAEWLVWEGPPGNQFLVHTWPEEIWNHVASAMANEAAEHGCWDSGEYS